MIVPFGRGRADHGAGGRVVCRRGECRAESNRRIENELQFVCHCILLPYATIDEEVKCTIRLSGSLVA